MSRRKSRGLSVDEQQLWNSVARTVAPLERQQEKKTSALPSGPLVLNNPASKAAEGQKLSHKQPSAPAQRRSPLNTADPQREKLVARGRLPIDAVIDLHGMRQGEADRATTAFLSRSIKLGHRVVLVITGKGSKDGEQGRGVLRKRFLQNAEGGLFGSTVTSVRPAHQRHGGQGAFYVFLKPPRRR